MSILDHKWGESDGADRVFGRISGLRPSISEALAIMVLQAYFDESESDGVFVLAGYVARPDEWAQFSKAWEAALTGHRRFKMSEAAQGPIERVIGHYRIIEEHAGLAVAVSFRTDDIASAIARISVSDGKKINWGGWTNPYHLAVRALTDVLNRRRSELGQVLSDTEVIDLYFDERGEEAKVRWSWDRIKEQLTSEEAALYGHKPVFEDDEKYLPLQAADFWAWWVRKWSIGKGYADISENEFPWPHDPEKPARMLITFDEDGLVEYLTNTVNLPYGVEFVVSPKGIG